MAAGCSAHQFFSASISPDGGHGDGPAGGDDQRRERFFDDGWAGKRRHPAECPSR